MAYCNNCGAYIPDGHSVCLACGADMNVIQAEAAKTAAAAKAAETADGHKAAAEDSGKYYSFTNEELRQRLDEQRRKQQEQSRKWAEQEKQRRQNRTQNTAQSSGSSDRSGNGAKKNAEVSSTKLFSVLSYISFLFALPMVFTPDDDKAMFHAKQGLRLFIYGIVSDSLSKVPLIGVLLNVGRIYLLVKGIVNAIGGKQEPLPYIGTIGDKK